MTSTFPKNPHFTGPLEPSRVEGSSINLEVVQGEIPESINGTFIRVQPDPLFPPMLGDDIFFNGDGVISAFKFENGRVDLNQRYVETKRVKLQREAGKSLFGRYRNPYTNDPSVSQDSVYSTANTNVVRFQDRLLALKEDNLPYAMDPETLETIGLDDLEGQINAATFSAHPKVDPVTGNFVNYSYRAKGETSRDIALYEFDTEGKKVNEIWFECPVVPFIHDFGLTPNYFIFPVIPVDYELELGKAGNDILYWNYERPVLFGVIRRDGDGSDVRWFEMPNAFPGHVQNAFEKDGKLYCDLALANDNVFVWWPDKHGRQTDLENMHGPMHRVEIDFSNADNKASSEALTDYTMEFSRIDDRYVGKPYRYGYPLAMDFSCYDFPTMGPPHLQFFNRIGKLDMETREFKSWCPGPTDSLQEPIFVLRNDDAPEGDGYIILLVNRLVTHSSDLVILDTAKLEDGPVATIKCPFRMRMGLHGNWVPAKN